MLMSAFHEKLRRLMSDKNLSDEEAARLIGDVSYSKVRRWRLASAEPSLSEAVRLADAFEVNLKSLAYDDEDVTPESDFESKMLNFLIRQIGIEEAVRRLTLARTASAEPQIPDLGHRRGIVTDEIQPPASQRKKPG